MSAIDVGARIGPYEILRKIGTGGMGAVYEAVHQAIERRVAIKILHPESARSPEIATRFLNEARAVNRISHPSMVQISDLGQLADGTAYLVMELLVGEPLNVRLRRLGGRLPLVQALDLGGQIADALSAAHDKGIIHRDLKPENVIVVADPVAPRGERIKVLDFGIAKLAESSLISGDGTRPSLLMGTPRYMSPEQCRGGGNVDAKADVYSLGVMMYQLISGKLPFDSKAPGELIVMHLMEPPPPLLTLVPDLDPALAPAVVPVIERLLTKSAAARPAMIEVAQQLQALSRQLAGHSADAIPILTSSAAIPVLPSPASAAPEALPGGKPTVPLTVVSDAVDVQTTTPPTPLSENPGAPNATLMVAASSTLGYSVGQTPLLATRRRYLFLLPIVFLLVVGILFAQRALTSKPAPGKIVTVAAANTVSIHDTARRTPSQWQLGSEPPGASVFRKADGHELGKTPLVVGFPAPQGPLAVELRLPGFITMNVELHPEDGEQRLVHLSAEDRPSVLRPPVAKKKEKAKGGKSFFDRID